MEELKNDKPFSQELVNQIIREIDDYKTKETPISDRATFNMYQTIQDIITHQNKEFLTPLSAEEVKDGVKRDFYDIITPMVETTVSNLDIDSKDIEAYTDDPNYMAQEYLATCLLRQFLRQTNHGEVINENEYNFVDDGNVFVRFIEEHSRRDNGDIYHRVMPQNIIVTDPTAETLEQTDYIEKCPMSQSDIRKMKNWDNINSVIELCDVGTTAPFYEVFYRYGEISKYRLGMVMNELHNIPYNYQEGDEENYIQSLIIMARANTKNLDTATRGVLTFAEQLKPKTYKITKKLTITRYKPVEMVRYGKYNGRLWGEGYREAGFTYQNRANEIANQLAEAMEVAKTMVFWSPDEKIAGKNIMSSIKNGQILKAEQLGLLNNVFPNLALFSEEWNRNINECQRALKSFEVATGENLPSSTSATAINVQNVAVGKYFNFKREKFGLFLSRIFKRWIIDELLKNIDANEAIEITGEASFVDEIVTASAKGMVLADMVKLAISMGANVDVPTQEMFEQIVELKKQELLKNPKLFATVSDEFFESIEMFVGINVTGEGFNKQAKISNAIQLLQYELNPALASNPDAMDTINWIKQMLGLKVKRLQQKSQNIPINQTNPVNAPMPNLSTKDQPETL